MPIFKTPKNPLYYLYFLGLAIAAVIILTNVVVYLRASSFIYENIDDVKTGETALILGAAVYADGDLTPVYKSRVDKAIELYNAKKVSKILASGDNSTVEHNEVNPVRDYLLAKGVPDVDIYLDHAGFDTYSTMYRARDIFKVTSVVIVTQSFHMPRAIFIARALGVNAYGLPTDDEKVKFFNYVREIFANEKALINLILHRQPKYLGEAIPIGEERVIEEKKVFIDTTNWKTYTDSVSKISFKYPEKLDTKYITLVDWPPAVNLEKGKITCLEAGEEEERAGKTEEIKINGNVYCLTTVLGAAAGSMYTEYAYAKALASGDTAILTFSTRQPQCANYDEPKKSECEAERNSFDINQLINSILVSIET